MSKSVKFISCVVCTIIVCILCWTSYSKTRDTDHLIGTLIAATVGSFISIGVLRKKE